MRTHFAKDEEPAQQSDEEIVLSALDGTTDEKLTGLTLRLVLSDHIGVPHDIQPDLLAEAEQVFAPKMPKVVKARAQDSSKPKPTAAKGLTKKEASQKKAA
jgi:ParB family chromosome partitioning protein